ncbi:actin, clone 302-like [Scyliorhinus canicula]|uniref:actin, clone 302-like n=1 Tax=Scyliorhinus canicula TaxID=7830 RepID=UPI0018F78ABB|nr:actin, clone 302-like [Scyliorhinus canicula]
MIKMMSNPAVIIDNGSGFCKSGIVGDSIPTSVIPSIVGCSKSAKGSRNTNLKDYYVGKAAQARKDVLSLKYPIERGIVTSWEEMEMIWRYIYGFELRVKSKERPVLLTTAPLTSFFNRERMAEIMFEGFSVPAMFLAIPATLALYTSGRTRGVVLDSGYGITDAVPIYEGYYLPDAVQRLNVAGSDITETLWRLILTNGHTFSEKMEREIVQEIKEKLSYIALDPKLESKKPAEELQHEYQLPDGTRIMLKNELFGAPELLFTPDSLGLKETGVHKLMLNSITKCEQQLHKELFSNMLLCGGSTLFPGMEERLLKDIKLHTPSGVQVKVIAPPERNYSVWVGASILTSLASFKHMWITLNDYNDFGPSVVNKRCF